MKRLFALGAVLLVGACSSTGAAATVPTPSSSPTAQVRPTLPVLQSASPVAGGRSPLPSALPVATVQCRNGSSAAAMVMLGGATSTSELIYDVSDALHPRLICSIGNTTAHLLTGDTFVYLKPVSANETDVILHSFGSGNESKVASFPLSVADPARGVIDDWAWTPDGGLLAYTVSDESANTVHVWLYSQGSAKPVHDYGQPIGDCICRFGVPLPILSFSPDDQYLADGWVAGKGATGITVIRVADRTTVFTADTRFSDALWAHSGHTLYFTGNFSPSADLWTPEGGLTTLPGGPWSFEPGISPDGTEAAYTAYLDPNTSLQPRVYTYDLKSRTARALEDKLRTEVFFVKDGWVWYAEERACTAADSCPGSTTPTGKVFGMQLSTAVEQPVTFAPQEAFTDAVGPGSSWAFDIAEYWPNS